MAEARDQRIVEYLKEARAAEFALLRLLAFHASLAASRDARTAARGDVARTRDRIARVTRRLDDLGVRVGSAPGLGVQLTVARALALASRPLQFLLGRTEDRLWDTAKKEVAIEGRAIASYFALETLAARVGDEETAGLAADLRADEERMLDSQRRQVPQLADAAVQAELAELSFDVTMTGSWWAQEELPVDQVRSALSRVKPPREERREATARQGNGSLAEPDRS